MAAWELHCTSFLAYLLVCLARLAAEDGFDVATAKFNCLHNLIAVNSLKNFAALQVCLMTTQELSRFHHRCAGSTGLIA
jgi:hypothetical protein